MLSLRETTDRPAPSPVRTVDLGHTLEVRFGHSEFRPGQLALVQAALAGRDAVGILPTGGGKSLCYLLPAMHLSGPVLVISPLLSLMEDQLRRAKGVGLRAAQLTSSQTARLRERILDRAARGEVDVLFVSPERVVAPRFRTRLRRVSVTLVVVDEAHCISLWGHDFRPSYRRLGRIRDGRSPPIMALTATATPAVRADIVGALGLHEPVEVVRSFDRPGLHWSVRPGRGHRAKVTHLGEALAGVSRGAVIVYASTRAAVHGVRAALGSLGRPVLAYHAGLDPEQRAQIQERFMAGEAPVLVATNAFGMGIDRSDVRLVAHYQLPGSLSAFYQEAGRAGRDRRPALSLALYDPADQRIQRRFLERSHPSIRALRSMRTRLLDRCGVGAHPAWRLRLALSHLDPSAWDAAVLRLIDAGVLDPVADSEPPAYLRLRGARPQWRRARQARRAAESALAAVQDYAETRGCRRRALLDHFGERLPMGACRGCDACPGGAPCRSGGR